MAGNSNSGRPPLDADVKLAMYHAMRVAIPIFGGIKPAARECAKMHRPNNGAAGVDGVPARMTRAGADPLTGYNGKRVSPEQWAKVYREVHEELSHF